MPKQYRLSCKPKRGHDNRIEAHKERQRLIEVKGIAPSRIHVYRCRNKHCGKWHVGRPVMYKSKFKL